MFQRILVPLDGSARAERAVPIAARIAQGSNGSVHLVQVEILPIDYTAGLSPAPLFTEATIARGTTEAEAYLHQLATSPHLAAIPTTTEVLIGTPASEILVAAEQRNIDLMVLCSHGRTGLTRWVLGSVASALVQESTVPTLVLRERDLSQRFLDPDRTQPFSALVPLDGSPLAEGALAPAAHLIAALAALAPATLHLAHVVASAQEMADQGKRSNMQDELATTYLSQVAERLRTMAKYLRLTITWSVIHGHDVASALVDLAEQGGQGTKQASAEACDLIALSTHGRGGLARLVMGSVAQRLLAATALPLLVVRPPQCRIRPVPQTSANFATPPDQLFYD